MSTETPSSVLLGVWTKSRPTVSGFYWYREAGEAPKVVEWDLEMGWVMTTGSDIMLGDDMSYGIEGEFWSVPILPPNVQAEAPSLSEVDPPAAGSHSVV